MIHIGTSGYSYDDWVGPFYPEGTNKRDFLTIYARQFGCSEVNYTYYRMPDAATLGAMASKTPPDFRFAVKAHSSMTHQRDADEATFAEFVGALEPLREQDKLACALAQFPGGFRLSQQNVDYLKHFRRMTPGLPVVIEFRHSSWICDEMFEFLREADFGFCCVDQPRLKGLLPPIAELTGSIAYLRLHGRNAEKWWKHDEAWERYNYLYSREELAEWAAKVRELDGGAEETYVFFNNHYNAQAVQNAQDFAELLQEQQE